MKSADYHLLQSNYNNYEGFVVLHGTDTMAYTASALSFMLENLGKTVIVTGSQVTTVIIMFSALMMYLLVKLYMSQHEVK